MANKILPHFNPAAWMAVMVSGATTGATATVTNLAVEDILLEVLKLNGATGAVLAVLHQGGTGECVVAAGTLGTTITDTSGNTLLIRYLDMSVAEA